MNPKRLLIINMSKNNRIRIPFRAAVVMVYNYARNKILEQAKAIAFILLYLVAFKIIVLQSAPTDALRISAGIGMVVFGLAFFLEGLFLGLMPLGERVGIQLPQRCNILVISAFGVLLGVSSTLAEPAISALRLAGTSVTPWATPLLYRMLEIETDSLVYAIASGVGVAVACGMIRFYYGFTLSPFIYSLVPLLLVISGVFAFDENLANIINLAWDTGAVTTGPVTVPLIIALGIGVSRSSGKQEGAASGFGIIALASLFPVLAVLALGFWMNKTTPSPVGEIEFFSQSNRIKALELVKSEKEMQILAFQRGNEGARRALLGGKGSYETILRRLADRNARSEFLGSMSLGDWLTQRASPRERTIIAAELAGKPLISDKTPVVISDVMTGEFKMSLRAVIPLVILLGVVLLLILRDGPKKGDEVLLGIFFAFLGMALLTSGIRLGLGPLGDQVGRPLPNVFRSETHEEGRVIFENFDLSSVSTAHSFDGTVSRFFYLKDRSGQPKAVSFDESKFDKDTGRYEHIVQRPPLFGPELTLVGIALVFLFAFGMGYGSTVAEPALSALGSTVEELTVGTIRRSGVVNTVSLGVGLGLLAGVIRILYNLSTVWIIVPAYALAVILTWFNDKDFADIAWDSGGVTTGPITVPLVLAMGLGIGGELNVVDGFGIVALASVFPVITMLIFGIMAKRSQRLVTAVGEVNDDE